MEKSFQEKGLKRNISNLKEKADMITFCNHYFDGNTILNEFQDSDMSIGLHTCGKLSLI